MFDDFACVYLRQRLQREQVALFLAINLSGHLEFGLCCARGFLHPDNSNGVGILIRIERASLERMEEAYSIVREYYEAVGVVVREDAESFAREYFGEGSGIWLAYEDATVVGCIALRPLPQFERAGEIKRMYVKPQARGRGIAERLLKALEDYAAQAGYRTLYLDTKDDLTTAIRFYQRHGYEPCERYNENPQATMFMKKRLDGD